MTKPPPIGRFAGLTLAVAMAVAAQGGGATAAGNANLPRCTMDQEGGETCRYPDGSSTRRWVDRSGVASFRDRDGTVTRERGGSLRDAAAIEVRGKTVARCPSDGKGLALCRR
jgi:hypothetical protein